MTTTTQRAWSRPCGNSGGGRRFPAHALTNKNTQRRTAPRHGTGTGTGTLTRGGQTGETRARPNDRRPVEESNRLEALEPEKMTDG